LTELSPGTILDERFQVLNEVGQGGMGIVYRARHIKMDRDVAVKVLRAALSNDPDKLSRFRREARVVSILDHPNIVQIYAVGIAKQGQPYIAMEFLSGRQLSDVIEHDGAIPWRDALKFMVQLCDALEYAHGKEIIHRDIKPSNILILHDDDSNEFNVKLVDFGIAKSLVEAGPALTQTEMVLGSVFYLSPGQFRGRAADARSDIYALGCTLFEMLAGVPPFRGDTVFDTVSKHNKEILPKVNQVKPDAQIPNDLQALLECMTEKNSDARPESAAVVRNYLLDIADGKPLSLKGVKRNSLKLGATQVRGLLMAAVVLMALFASAVLLPPLLNQKHAEQQSTEYLSLCMTGDPLEKQCASEVLKASKDPTLRRQLAEDYHNLSVIYRKHDRFMAAYLVANEAWHLVDQKISDDLSSDIAANLGQTLSDIGRRNEAADLLLNTALFQAAHNRSPYASLVAAFFSLTRAGRWDAAMKQYERLLPHMQDRPQDVIPLYFMAFQTAYRAGRYDVALDCVKQIEEHQVNPSAPSKLRNRIFFLLVESATHKAIPRPAYDAALKDLNALPDNAGERAFLWCEAAELMIRTGHVQEGYAHALKARQVLIKLAETRPDWANLADAEWMRNDLIGIASLLPPDKSAAIVHEVELIGEQIQEVKRKLSNPALYPLPVPTPHADRELKRTEKP
jgi:serine/threonine protein kinase